MKVLRAAIVYKWRTTKFQTVSWSETGAEEPERAAQKSGALVVPDEGREKGSKITRDECHVILLPPSFQWS
jgi:hypothetical protein